MAILSTRAQPILQTGPGTFTPSMFMMHMVAPSGTRKTGNEKQVDAGHIMSPLTSSWKNKVQCA